MIYISSLSHTHTQTHKGWSMLQCLNAFIASKRRLYSPLWVKENRKRVTGGGFVYIICVALCEVWTWKAISMRGKLREGVTYLFVIYSIYRLYLVLLPLTDEKSNNRMWLTSCPKISLSGLLLSWVCLCHYSRFPYLTSCLQDQQKNAAPQYGTVLSYVLHQYPGNPLGHVVLGLFKIALCFCYLTTENEFYTAIWSKIVVIYHLQICCLTPYSTISWSQEVTETAFFMGEIERSAMFRIRNL